MKVTTLGSPGAEKAFLIVETGPGLELGVHPGHARAQILQTVSKPACVACTFPFDPIETDLGFKESPFGVEVRCIAENFLGHAGG